MEEDRFQAWEHTVRIASHSLWYISFRNLKSEVLITMKTAYELAMERLNQASSVAKLTAAQKKQLAALDSKYRAKIAERELALQEELTKASAAGDFEKAEQLQQQFFSERKALQVELEDRKEQVRTPTAQT